MSQEEASVQLSSKGITNASAAQSQSQAHGFAPYLLLALLVHSLSLLLDIVLGAALLRLASVVLVLELGLLGTVACEAGNSTAQGSRDAVGHARGIVVQLARSLLLLARKVLLTAGLLQRLDMTTSAPCHLGQS
jgi:hypothetical protein